MTIIQHRDCGDEQEKKERVFEAWAVLTARGDLCLLSTHRVDYPNAVERGELHVVPCRVIVEEP